VKRAALVRHLEERGCWLLREGGRHSVFFNPETRRLSSAISGSRGTQLLPR
jgi:hypothetical protein